MRPNLSFENFVNVLAVLGTGALVACAGREPQPLHAKEISPPAAAGASAGVSSTLPTSVPPANAAAAQAEKAANPTATQGEASCCAGTCSGDAKKKLW